MKGASWIIFAGLLAVISFSRGVPAKSPYDIILARNPFALRQIPPPLLPPPPDLPPGPPPTDVRLTGLTTLLGAPLVFLEISNAQTRKIERPPPMRVGDIEFGVKILGIDTTNNLVRINNGTSSLTLDFEHNGIKPGAAAPGISPVQAPHTGLVPAVLAPVAPSTGRAIVAGGPSAPTVTPAMHRSSAPYPAGAIPAEMEARIEAQRRLLEEQEKNAAARFRGLGNTR